MKCYRRKRRNPDDAQSGFTLVELIVVLVIMTILAAITVPALTGWIDKAKDKQAMIHARTVYLAAQTVTAEQYGELDTDEFDRTFGEGLTVTNECMDEDSVEGEIASLAGVEDPYIAQITVSDGKVTEMTYTPESGQPVTFGETE